jgi:hypothetical protein
MTVLFRFNNDIILHALENIIPFCKDNPYIFADRSVRWLSTQMESQQDSIIHINQVFAGPAIDEDTSEIPLKSSNPTCGCQGNTQHMNSYSEKVHVEFITKYATSKNWYCQGKGIDQETKQSVK